MKELVSSRPGWEPSVGSAGSRLCAEAAGLDLRRHVRIGIEWNGGSSCLFWSAGSCLNGMSQPPGSSIWERRAWDEARSPDGAYLYRKYTPHYTISLKDNHDLSFWEASKGE